MPSGAIATLASALRTASDSAAATAVSIVVRQSTPSSTAAALSAGNPGQQGDLGFGIAEGQPAGANPELAGMLDDFFKQG